jgi:hypothetical protein
MHQDGATIGLAGAGRGNEENAGIGARRARALEGIFLA